MFTRVFTFYFYSHVRSKYSSSKYSSARSPAGKSSRRGRASADKLVLGGGQNKREGVHGEGEGPRAEVARVCEPSSSRRGGGRGLEGVPTGPTKRRGRGVLP